MIFFSFILCVFIMMAVCDKKERRKKGNRIKRTINFIKRSNILFTLKHRIMPFYVMFKGEPKLYYEWNVKEYCFHAERKKKKEKSEVSFIADVDSCESCVISAWNLFFSYFRDFIPITIEDNPWGGTSKDEREWKNFTISQTQ